MKRIKLFESFTINHRLPTKVGHNEWSRKLDMYNREEFTQNEKEFFKNISKNLPSSKNPSYVDMIHNASNVPSEISMYIYNPAESGYNKEVIIYKLQDNWYLIFESGPDVWDEDFANDPTEDPTYKYFIADEWDEVLGYFQNNNLNLPS